MNSEAIRTTTQRVMASTAPQAGWAEPRLASDALMSVMESVLMADMVRAQSRLEGWTSVLKGERDRSVPARSRLPEIERLLFVAQEIDRWHSCD